MEANIKQAIDKIIDKFFKNNCLKESSFFSPKQRTVFLYVREHFNRLNMLEDLVDSSNVVTELGLSSVQCLMLMLGLEPSLSIETNFPFFSGLSSVPKTRVMDLASRTCTQKLEPYNYAIRYFCTDRAGCDSVTHQVALQIRCRVSSCF